MIRNKEELSLIDLMYRGTTTIQNFCWDNLATTPILSLLSLEDIYHLHKLITSSRYSGNARVRLKKIDEIMQFRGFTKFAGGTNRVVYTHPNAPNAVFKVAIDSVGIEDNPAEFRNQQFLKPYCCKVFECSPCGTIASFEKVDRITTFEEFYSIADDYFYLLSRVILGKYVMEDIGIDYFMNVGIRKGFGVVILDFPYLFELDGAKLRCSAKFNNGKVCGGEIDYDAGFNKLVCKSCGKPYSARDLSKPPSAGGIYINGGKYPVHLKIVRGDRVIKEVYEESERDYLSENDTMFQNRQCSNITNRAGRVRLMRGNKCVYDSLNLSKPDKTTKQNPKHSEKKDKQQDRLEYNAILEDMENAALDDADEIVFLDELIDVKEAINNIFFCVPKPEFKGKVNTEDYNNLELTDIADVDVNMFDIYQKCDDQWSLVIIDEQRAEN